MPTDVVMPQMGEAVERDEPLFEISTDKVDAEIPSPAAGVITEIRANEGQTVEVNTVVAVIGEAGAKPVAAAAPKQPEAPGPKPAAPPPARPGRNARPPGRAGVGDGQIDAFISAGAEDCQGPPRQYRPDPRH